MTPGPKPRHGESRWVRRKVPGAADDWLLARAEAEGVSVQEMLARILFDAMADGPAVLRSTQHKAEADQLRRQLVSMAGDVNRLAEREAAARKKAKELAYAYRALASAVRLPGDKLRASISKTLAQIAADTAPSPPPRQATLRAQTVAQPRHDRPDRPPPVGDTP
jgi:hypothetical protein